MPYICVRTNVTIPDDKKELIKSELGRLLPLIPGKLEAGLMVELVDQCTMYKAGTDAPCAMVDMRCYKQAQYDDNKNFVEAALAMLGKALAIEDPTRIYMSVGEFDAWGTGGVFKH